MGSHSLWDSFVASPLAAICAFLAIAGVLLVALPPPPSFEVATGQLMLSLFGLGAVALLAVRRAAPVAPVTLES